MKKIVIALVSTTAVVHLSAQIKPRDTLTQNIDEVIIVGYGKTTKLKVTDNIAKIDGDKLKDTPNPNFQEGMVGKAAGVRVMQTNGKLEAGFDINIRGTASISASSSPLYVIDGVPMITKNESTNGAPVNPLVTLPASEIESVEILKDASSAAIYGSRGSNGVILITTRSGKTGAPRLSLNLAQGFSAPTNRIKMLNAAQYVELMLEAGRNVDDESFVKSRLDRYSNKTDWRSGEIDTDWQDHIFRAGGNFDGDFTVSGGAKNFNYLFTGATSQNTGIVQGNDLDRNSARLNASATPVRGLKLGLNLAFSKTGIDRVANDNEFTNPMQAIALPPISPAYVNGEPFSGSLYPNFLAEDKYAYYKTDIQRLTGKFSGEYQIYSDLKFASEFGYDNYNQTEVNYRGRNAPRMSTNGYLFNSFVNSENYVLTNFLTYNKDINNHHFNAVAGTEYIKDMRTYSSVTGINFPSDEFQTISSAGEVTAGSGNKTANAFFSYFGRVSYDYNGKYLFKASLRRDGSSRFGEDNRFATFPALSAGWVVSKENFMMDQTVLSLLKLRASWGKTGNAEIGNHAAKDLWTAIKYNNQPGITNSQPANRMLMWESAKQIDAGIDMGFFRNRISLELDWYQKDSEGLLFVQDLPYTTGYSYIYNNFGDLRNQGFEVVLNTKNFQKENFRWETNFNVGYNDNKIVALPNGNADIIVLNTIRRVGEKLGSFYLPEYAGVDPANGDALYYKNTKLADGSLDRTTTNDYSEANYVITGSYMPDWTGGLTNSLGYRNLDLSFTFYGEFGASIYNSAGKFQSTSGDWFDNQTIDQLTRWQKPGDITMVPQARLDAANGTQESTRYLQKRDFVRLRNVTVGYTLNKDFTSKMGMSQFRIYAAGTNLLTFTKYDGYDPASIADTGRGGGGAAFYSPPSARTVSLGVNVNF